MVVREDRVTYDPGSTSQAQNEYELKVPLDSSETEDAGNTLAKDRAVSNANAVKAAGSHILTVAVGNGLGSQVSLNRIIDVSGPGVFPDDGAFDIATTDVYREPDFSQLEAALRQAAFDLCAPSVTVRKLLDQNPNPGISPENQLVPGEGWSMTTDVTPTPDDWVLPADGAGGSATQETDAGGFATFQWTPAAAGPSQIDVTEEDPGGVPPGYANRPAQTECVFRTQDRPDDQPLAIVTTDGGFSATVPEESIVTCTMVNEALPDPAVDIEKYTNGADADDPTGPFVPVGEPITWSYLVTNTGNVTFDDIAVTDDPLGEISCPEESLSAGQDMTCNATGVSTAGQYENLGSVTATDPFGTGVDDEDPSHYFGSAPGIDVEKSTNGEDADNPPGPVIPVGDPVEWEYVVTNMGNEPIADVELTDRQGVVPVFETSRTSAVQVPTPAPRWPTPTRRTTSVKSSPWTSRSPRTSKTPTNHSARSSPSADGWCGDTWSPTPATFR